MSWVTGAERFYGSVEGDREFESLGHVTLHTGRQDLSVDLISYEVIRHRLWQICDEMGATLRRVSGSPVATEASDFATMIADEKGAGVFMGPFVLNHAVVLEDIIRWTLQNRALNPGIRWNDMFLCNDPWVGAAHQNDVAVYAPLFIGGDLFAWSGTTIHQVDVGGPSPGSFTIAAQDVFGEGSPIPPIKIMRQGELQHDVEDIYIRRSRQPEMLQLDLRAQIAANNVAHERIRELTEKFGTEIVKAVMKGVMNKTEETLRKRLDQLPNGTWRHVDNIEIANEGDRGVYQVRCAMTNSGTDLHFDFTGTHKQVGMINGGSGAAIAGVMAAILPMLAGDIAWSSGAVRRLIKLTNPRGTLINSEYPAACSIASTSAICAVHNCTQATVAKMLCTLPDHRKRVLAGGGGSWPAMQVMGENQYGKAFVTQFQEPVAMGFGARSWADGVNTAGPYAIPAARMANVETTELLWPVLVLYRHEVIDTGGAGRWRGGLGANFSFILHGTSKHLTHVSAAACVAFPAHGGLSGGCPGNACRYLLVRNSNHRELMGNGYLPSGLGEVKGDIELLSPKSQVQQGPEDFYEITFYGGGGYGDPLDRSLDLLKKDVENGAVSNEAAKEIYGVVFNEGSGEIDYSATVERKNDIRQHRLGGVKPLRKFMSPSKAKTIIGKDYVPISEYVHITNDRMVCSNCEYDFCSASENYKQYLVIEEYPITRLTHINREPINYVDDDIVCRAFYCPGCATQNEFEITDTRLPPIWDCQLKIN